MTAPHPPEPHYGSEVQFSGRRIPGVVATPCLIWGDGGGWSCAVSAGAGAGVLAGAGGGASVEDAAARVGVSASGARRWFGQAGGMSLILPSRRGGICRLPSGRRSRSGARNGMGCARSPAGSGARRRRSPASCAATPPRAAAGWRTGPRPRSGTPTARPPSEAGQAGDQPAAAAVRAGPARRCISAPNGASGARARRAVEAAPARAAAGPALGHGVEPGADRPPVAARVPRRSEPCRFSHETIYQSLYVQGRGALRRELAALPAHRPGAAQAARQARRSAGPASPEMV